MIWPAPNPRAAPMRSPATAPRQPAQSAAHTALGSTNNPQSHAAGSCIETAVPSEWHGRRIRAGMCPQTSNSGEIGLYYDDVLNAGRGGGRVVRDSPAEAPVGGQLHQQDGDLGEHHRPG